MLCFYIRNKLVEIEVFKKNIHFDYLFSYIKTKNSKFIVKKLV